MESIAINQRIEKKSNVMGCVDCAKHHLCRALEAEKVDDLESGATGEESDAITIRNCHANRMIIKG